MKNRLIAFVLSESQKMTKGEVVELRQLQSAPHYFETTVPHQSIIGQENREINGTNVLFFIKSYLPDILLIEANMEVEDVFSSETFEWRELLIDECHRVSKKYNGNFEMSEEYSVAIISEYEGEPEQFFNRSAEIVRFLKSEKITLDEHEIERVMEKQIKYAKNDLAIVGWDGSFLFEPNSQYESTIELFQITNLQLLRYRILEQDLSERLKKVSKSIQKSSQKKFFDWGTKDLAKSFKEVIAVRAQSISQFEVIEREIKLIGDWYSARLYEMLSKLFRIEEWRLFVKDKLESLEDVYNIVAENFSITNHQALELIQIILFFVLQLGWFILIFLELGIFFK